MKSTQVRTNANLERDFYNVMESLGYEALMDKPSVLQVEILSGLDKKIVEVEKEDSKFQ